MRNPQDFSSEEEEWLAQDPANRTMPEEGYDARMIAIMRRRLAQIDLTDPRRLQCMPAPLPRTDVSWSIEKTSIPGRNPRENRLAEMCNGCYRAKAVCTCDHGGDAS